MRGGRVIVRVVSGVTWERLSAIASFQDRKGPWAKECRQPLEARKGKVDSYLEAFSVEKRQLIFILLLHAWKKLPCSLFLVSHTQGPEELGLPSLFPLRVLGALGVQAYTQGTLSPQGRRPRWDFFSGSSHLQTQKSVSGGRWRKLLFFSAFQKALN